MINGNAELAEIQRAFSFLKESIKQRKSSNYDQYEDLLEKILISINDGMKRSVSSLAHIANYWNELSLWQKLLGGIAVSGLPLALNVVSFSFCMKLAGVNATAYIMSGLLLAEHSQKAREAQKMLISTSRNVLFFVARELEISLESELNVGFNKK
jgi:hypothetical protein